MRLDQTPGMLMVALGSSYAAGPGLEPVADAAAMRSARNYPHLVADVLGARLIDSTVSGATTDTILRTAQRQNRRWFPPQITAVHVDTDLVTLTAGGNDLSYIRAVIGAAYVGLLGQVRPTRPVARVVRRLRPLRLPSEEQMVAATTGLARIVEEVRHRAPQARVVLVDYLPVFDPGTVPAPFEASDVAHFRAVAATLSAAFAEASRRTGADLVPASAYGQGHGIGSADPWVSGQHRRSPATSFHPTIEGMRVVADRVVDHLGGRE